MYSFLVRVDEMMHMVALVRVNRLLLVYPLAALFEYFEAKVHRNIIYIRYFEAIRLDDSGYESTVKSV